MTVASINIEELVRIHPRTILSRLHIEPGEPLNIVQLEKDLDLIFGLGDFEFIDYRLWRDQDGIRVVLKVREKPWAPNYMHGSVRIALDDDENTSIDLLTNLTVRPLNALNAEWRTDLVVGSQQRLATEFFQPLDYSGRLFISAGLLFSRLVDDVFIDQKHAAEFEAQSLVGQVATGVSLGTMGEFRLGLNWGRFDLSLKEGFQPDGFVDEIDMGGWSASLVLDTLNSTYFPREGGILATSFYSSRPSLGARDRYDTIRGSGVFAKSWNRHTIITWIEGGLNRGDDVPGYAWFPLGGLFSMSGYEPGELSGRYFGVFRPMYIYRVARLPSVIGKGVYLGGWIEAGNVWADSGNISIDDLRYATTLVLGAETMMGPFYFAYGLAEEGHQRWYLSLGATFGSYEPGS